MSEKLVSIVIVFDGYVNMTLENVPTFSLYANDDPDKTDSNTYLTPDKVLEMLSYKRLDEVPEVPVALIMEALSLSVKNGESLLSINTYDSYGKEEWELVK